MSIVSLKLSPIVRKVKLKAREFNCFLEKHLLFIHGFFILFEQSKQLLKNLYISEKYSVNITFKLQILYYERD